MHMVSRQTLQAATAQPIDTRVAEMNDVGATTAQDQGAEGGRHTAQARVLPALRAHPAVHRRERARRGTFDAQGFGQSKIAVDKSAYRRFSGEPTAPPTTDAIGHGRDQ